MSENTPARRVEDKRADSAVDWTDAPRFNALGIAEAWSVTVEAEGRRVLCISDSHYAGVSEAEFDQFHETIRSCAMHLLGFIGVNPAISSAVPTASSALAVQAHAAVSEQVPTAAEAPRQWISVEDRLPEDGAHVIVAVPGHETPVWPARWLSESQTFESSFMGWLEKNEASHWMPLPAAPKQSAQCEKGGDGDR